MTIWTETATKKIFFWHVHGSYARALVQGPHRYFVPVVPDRGPDGRGRAQTWDWPATTIEVTRDQARTLDIDLVIAQRPHELDELIETWLERTPGRDVPVIYLEHDAPEVRIDALRHPVSERVAAIVHVTHFNHLFWDCGGTPTRVIEHGIVDPGYRYTGELARAAVAVNEAARRGRMAGTDLLPRFSSVLPVDLFAPPQSHFHHELPKRRVYLHPMRWASLGLALIEAMQLGMPVVALATTETVEAVPSGCGVISTDVERLCHALRRYAGDADAARADGLRARAYACGRYGLERFLRAWNALFDEVTA